MKSITILFIALFITFSSIAQENKSEHKAFLDKVFQLLEQRVANPRWLEEDSFIKFKHHMYAEETLNLDEKEFYLTFNRQCNTLSFTHFYLKKVKSTTTASEDEIEKLSWKKMNDSTAYLDVRSFAGGAHQMYQALQEIGTDTFENLIIDLRNNGGGSLDAPVILGQFLTHNPIDAGVYLTRGWYTNHTKPATAEEITSLPFLMDFTYTRNNFV